MIIDAARLDCVIPTISTEASVRYVTIVYIGVLELITVALSDIASCPSEADVSFGRAVLVRSAWTVLSFVALKFLGIS